jgi:hypothetical protein
MEKDCERGSISSKNYDLADTTVQSFGCFVRTLLQLSVMRGLLNDVQDFLSYKKSDMIVCNADSNTYSKQRQPQARQQIHFVLLPF